MVRNIAIKDAIYQKLSELKGEGSFSTAIESLLNKNKIAPVQTAQARTGAAQHPGVSEDEGDE